MCVNYGRNLTWPICWLKAEVGACLGCHSQSYFIFFFKKKKVGGDKELKTPTMDPDPQKNGSHHIIFKATKS